ncbi:hypothetical protein CYMTET_15159 [Cymbomonas tetramitiformis]|uniref:Uncharacterized protein n=1 Tax=Cymbomonas tetramitiformis TaxID=36881 RepID=A0AAE0L973_9CHLO|nr:hypothetical protein CYMTET_15159 [Cymbomonas tetramitiformis]
MARVEHNAEVKKLILQTKKQELLASAISKEEKNRRDRKRRDRNEQRKEQEHAEKLRKAEETRNQAADRAAMKEAA